MVGHVYLKSGGAWVEPTNLYVKTGGAWVDPTAAYVKTGGVWEQFYPAIDPTKTLDLDFTATTTLDPSITFSRASTGSAATYFDSAGVLKYAAHNHFIATQDFAGASWTKANGATVTADAITAPDGTSTADRLNHVTAGTVNGGYVHISSVGLYRTFRSVYAKAGTKNWLIMSNVVTAAGSVAGNCYFDLSTGTVGTKGSTHIASGMAAAGGGWYRCWIESLVATAGNATSFRVAETNGTVTCTSPGDIYIWGAQYESVSTETTPRAYLPNSSATIEAHAPRFDYDPVTHAPKGLLIEGSVANSVSNPQDFAQATWSKTGLTVTDNQTTGPDGTTTGDLITATASTATIAGTAGITTGAVYAQSVYAKKGTSDWIYMVGQSVDSPKVWFNLATGAVGTIQAGLTATGIQNIGNGWYRCWFTDVGQAGAEPVTVGLCDADNSAAVTIGRTAYLWGAQSEQNNDFVSSYIPFTGTRAADVATMTGTNFSSWYNQTAGTFVAEFDVLAASGTRGILAADNNTAAEMIRLYGSGTDPKVTITDNSATQADLDVGTIAGNTIYKLGVSYAANDIAACINGGTVGTDTVATLPTPTQLRIGTESATAANVLNGHVRRLSYWNTAKSDSDLQGLTAP